MGADHPNEERELFLESHRNLDKALARAVAVSSAHYGKPAPHIVALASAVFGRLIKNGVSIYDLSRNHAVSKDPGYPLDHSAIASIARTAIDASIMTIYLVNSWTEDDWERLRYSVLCLHDATVRYRIFKSAAKFMEGTDPDPSVSDYKEIAAELKNRIVSNSRFAQLSAEEQERAVTGQSVFVRGLRAAIRESGMSVDWYEFHNSYFSSFVHAHPVSFFRFVEHELDPVITSSAQYSTTLTAILSTCHVLERATEHFDNVNISLGVPSRTIT